MKQYTTVKNDIRIENVIKHSRFIATIRGNLSIDTVDTFLNEVRKEFSDATHNCYAYVINNGVSYVKFSDDGEPGGTAGQPILDAIKKNNLNNVCVVVTRYFGGIKLGAGGLVGAYSDACAQGLKKAQLQTYKEANRLKLVYDYTYQPYIEKFIRQNEIKVDNTIYDFNITMEILVSNEVKNLEETLKEITNGKILIEDLNEKVLICFED